jgi:hypothetical protein
VATAFPSASRANEKDASFEYRCCKRASVLCSPTPVPKNILLLTLIRTRTSRISFPRRSAISAILRRFAGVSEAGARSRNPAPVSGERI